MELLRNVRTDNVPVNAVVICPGLSGPQFNVASQSVSQLATVFSAVHLHERRDGVTE
jgi:hypothetical protein